MAQSHVDDNIFPSIRRYGAPMGGCVWGGGGGGGS